MGVWAAEKAGNLNKNNQVVVKKRKCLNTNVVLHEFRIKQNLAKFISGV